GDRREFEDSGSWHTWAYSCGSRRRPADVRSYSGLDRPCVTVVSRFATLPEWPLRDAIAATNKLDTARRSAADNSRFHWWRQVGFESCIADTARTAAFSAARRRAARQRCRRAFSVETIRRPAMNPAAAAMLVTIHGYWRVQRRVAAGLRPAALMSPMETGIACAGPPIRDRR